MTSGRLLPAVSQATRAGISRRSFLMRAGAAAAGAMLVPSAEAFTRGLGRERILNFYNPNTEEDLTIACCIDADYDARIIRRFSYFMRDHHSNKVHYIDPALIDLLYAVSVLTRSHGTFQVISGYRAPETNRMLRRVSRRVAEHSLIWRARRSTFGCPTRTPARCAKSAWPCNAVASAIIRRPTSSTSTPATCVPGDQRASHCPTGPMTRWSVDSASAWHRQTGWANRPRARRALRDYSVAVISGTYISAGLRPP